MPEARFALIDMGTNTFHLLVASASGEVIYRTKTFVRIGRGGISAGKLTEPAIRRAVAALVAFRQTIDAHKIAPEDTHVVATSAVRNAHNQAELLRRVYARTGLRVRVISGEEEAGLIFRGVRRAIPLDDACVLVMDIGGGSVEFVLGNATETHWQHSFEIGAQRLLDLFGTTDPIAAGSVEKLDFFLEENLVPLTNAVHQYAPRTLVGSSGTFDTLVEMHHHALDVLPERGVAEELPVAAFQALHSRLLVADRAERLAMPGMVEERVDMIVVASCLVAFVLRRYQLPTLRVSAYALKEGLLNQVVAGRS